MSTEGSEMDIDELEPTIQGLGKHDWEVINPVLNYLENNEPKFEEGNENDFLRFKSCNYIFY